MKQPLTAPAARVAFWRLRDAWPVMLLLTACLLLAAGGEELRQLARYDRQAIESGEYWRLASGHLVHLGTGHLWPNLAALVVIGLLFEGVLGAGAWWRSLLASAVAIDVGLYLREPTLDWYVGLSGVLHGIVAAGALVMLLRRQALGIVLAMGLAGKLLYEQTAGPVPFTAESVGGPVVVAAHLYGAAGAALSEAAAQLVRRRSARV